MELGLVSQISRSDRKRAAARLRLRITDLLHAALKESGLKKADLGRELGIDRSGVTQVIEGSGNITVNTLADYLSAMGYELDLLPVQLGEIVESMREHRAPRVEPITMRDCYRLSQVPPRVVYAVNAGHRNVDHLNGSKSMSTWTNRAIPERTV